MKKHLLEISGLVLSIIALALIISFAISTRPKGDNLGEEQGDIAQLLEERLKQRDVSVSNVKTLKQSPLEIEIILQSPGAKDNIGQEDLWNEFIANREAELANRANGTHIESYRIAILNTQGENIFDSTTYLAPDRPSQKFNPAAPSPVDRDQTKNILNQSFNPGDLKLVSLDVSPKYFDEWKSKLVILEMSIDTISHLDAEPLITDFIINLTPQIEAINTQYDTRIAIVWVKIHDAKGDLIVDYLEDIDLGTQTFWVADDIHGGWYSEPAPVASAIPTSATIPIATNTSILGGDGVTLTPTAGCVSPVSGPYPSPPYP